MDNEFTAILTFVVVILSGFVVLPVALSRRVITKLATSDHDNGDDDGNGDTNDQMRRELTKRIEDLERQLRETTDRAADVVAGRSGGVSSRTVAFQVDELGGKNSAVHKSATEDDAVSVASSFALPPTVDFDEFFGSDASGSQGVGEGDGSASTQAHGDSRETYEHGEELTADERMLVQDALSDEGWSGPSGEGPKAASDRVLHKTEPPLTPGDPPIQCFKICADFSARPEHVVALGLEADLYNRWMGRFFPIGKLVESTASTAWIFAQAYIPWPVKNRNLNVWVRMVDRVMAEQSFVFLLGPGPGTEGGDMEKNTDALPSEAKNGLDVVVMRSAFVVSAASIEPGRDDVNVGEGDVLRLRAVLKICDKAMPTMPSWLLDFVLKLVAPFILSAIRGILKGISTGKDPHGHQDFMEQRPETYLRIATLYDRLLTSRGSRVL